MGSNGQYFQRRHIPFRGKTYMNDVFSKHGEAGGQYYYPKQVNFYDISKNKILRLPLASCKFSV